MYLSHILRAVNALLLIENFIDMRFDNESHGWNVITLARDFFTRYISTFKYILTKVSMNFIYGQNPQEVHSFFSASSIHLMITTLLS